MISIIIPTLNEEKLLPRLLQNIKDQTFKDYEIIVADADSTDRTREIAQSFGCKVIKGGMPGPARNNGAEAASGDYFVFFDADVSIDEYFLEKAFEEFQKRYLEITTCDYIPDSDDGSYSALFDLYNSFNHTLQYVKPSSLGSFMMMTRRLFFRLGGFDESIKLGEDFEMVKRASKISKFRILENVSINISVRRIEKEGVFKYITRNIRSELYRAFIGEITDTDVIEYEFGNYDSKKDKKELKDSLKKLKFSVNNAKKNQQLKKWFNDLINNGPKRQKRKLSKNIK
ncbi:MAG: glycosyltransferase [Candidatus Woesearchaeota archaeon]